jgi:hypothetical protein
MRASRYRLRRRCSCARHSRPRATSCSTSIRRRCGTGRPASTGRSARRKKATSSASMTRRRAATSHTSPTTTRWAVAGCRRIGQRRLQPGRLRPHPRHRPQRPRAAAPLLRPTALRPRATARRAAVRRARRRAPRATQQRRHWHPAGPLPPLATDARRTYHPRALTPRLPRRTRTAHPAAPRPPSPLPRRPRAERGTARPRHHPRPRPGPRRHVQTRDECGRRRLRRSARLAHAVPNAPGVRHAGAPPGRCTLPMGATPRPASTDLPAQVQAQLPQTRYTSAKAAYDLRKLRSKGFASKLPGSRRCLVAAAGIRGIGALLILREQVVRPVLAGALHAEPSCEPTQLSVADRHYHALRQEMQALFQVIGIAA